MPNWIDDEGYNWYGKLECKRCLGRFDTDKDGEVPTHRCLGGWYKSESYGGLWHQAVFVRPFDESTPNTRRGRNK